MFCPKCRDEFRPGFERCGRCNVDLVHDLSAAAKPEAAPTPVQTFLKMADFCGFLSLDEARKARDELAEHDIRSDILVRQVPDDGGRLEEEFWIRVDAKRVREVTALLGIPEGGEMNVPDDDGGFECGDCGHHVADEEKFCPNCGARFEDD